MQKDAVPFSNNYQRCNKNTDIHEAGRQIDDRQFRSATFVGGGPLIITCRRAEK